MGILKIPVKIAIETDKGFRKEKEVVKFLSTFNNDMLPDDVNPNVYLSFLEFKEYENHKKLVFPNLFLKLDWTNGDGNQLLRIALQLRDEIKNKFKVDLVSVSGKSNFITIWEKNNEFECVSVSIGIRKFESSEIEIKTKMKGHIDNKVIKSFNKKLYENARRHLEKLSGGPREVDAINLTGKSKQYSANFIFIRSLFDFINSAPSESFSRAFLGISQNYPFLFEPKNKFWNKLLSQTEEQQNKILYPLLLRTRGLTRQEFEMLIRWWVNMIEFLRKECDGDARKFFKVVSFRLGIDTKRSDALEVIQSLLENYDEIKKYLGITFPYSLKAGRLFLTMMTKNERGFDLIDGVNNEQVKELNLPVDAQVLRVALNTGLIEIMWVDSENFEFEGRKAKVLYLKRSDMTELARVAWKLVAENIGIPTIELDYLVYSVGSLTCNRFGKSCYACPITDICKSWADKKIKEGAGVDWDKVGLFSYGKGEFDALVIRPCEKCDGKLGKCIHKYDIQKFSKTQEKINLNKII